VPAAIVIVVVIVPAVVAMVTVAPVIPVTICVHHGLSATLAVFRGSRDWMAVGAAKPVLRNSSYSQWVGREELFERERKSNPDDAALWDGCVLACESARAGSL
jgi:hypothetical protein